MTGKIFIKNLTVKANVGHLIDERRKEQNLLLNVAVWADVQKSIKTEDLADTIDYCVIQDEIVEFCAHNEFVLIETLANALLDLCMKDTRIEKAWIRLEKPHKLPGSDSVGIELEKMR